MKLNIGVIFGGESVEHEISVITALQAIDNINKEKYNVIPIYIGKNRVWYTSDLLLNIENYKDIDILIKKCNEVTLCKKNNEYCLVTTNRLLNKIINKIDVAFPIVHGQNVEDGTLAGFLDTLKIPYVGPKVLGASIGQDKVVQKLVLKSSGIPVTDFIWFYDTEFETNESDTLKKIEKIGYPVVVKPANLGSSVGINFVKDEKTIIDAINEAIMYDQKIIVEKAVMNLIEVNQSVLGNYESLENSLIEEVLSDNSILTYEDKYIGNSKSKNASKGMVNTKRIIPANISKELTKKISDNSLKTFKVLNLSGVVRIDYLIDSKTKAFYVNEVNTIPGSLSFYLWEPMGKKYEMLLDELITLSIKEYKTKQKKNFSFNTNILKNYKIGGIKK